MASEDQQEVTVVRLQQLLEETDWHSQQPACPDTPGAPDTPVILARLLNPNCVVRSWAVRDLTQLVLHQDTIYGATAPAARIVAELLRDPRTLISVRDERDSGDGQPLRVALLNWLADVAHVATWDGGRPEVAECRQLRPTLFYAVKEFVDDASEAISEAALAACAELLKAPELAAHVPTMAPAVRSVLVNSNVPSHRWAGRSALEAWGEHVDWHPRVSLGHLDGDTDDPPF